MQIPYLAWILFILSLYPNTLGLKIVLRSYIYLMYMGVLLACVCVLCLCSAYRGQKRTSDIWNWNYTWLWVLGAKLHSLEEQAVLLTTVSSFQHLLWTFYHSIFGKLIKQTFSGTVPSFDFSFNILSLHGCIPSYIEPYLNIDLITSFSIVS